ncbi:MAG: sugar transporter [Bacteroidetes bacterium HGW-Bacteroidetes-2]|jgi:polysaccharide export outer membrane protein|nr:MAG: sugar transporter [Bacteroidetes bacterium HGW-Bacteroidetes-2]
MLFQRIRATVLRIQPLIAVLFFILFVASSCVSKKEILYMQDIEKLNTAAEVVIQNNPVIHSNDILVIQVSSYDMEASAPFNLLAPARNILEQGTSQNLQGQGYLVNNDGSIEFPVLGTLQVGGMTRQELVEDLKTKISVYVKDPIINIRISNFKVTVLGEVTRPGDYYIENERITLLEAFGKAGDLTIFGKRDNILILREQNGIKTYNKIDITKSDFLDSPYYYLQQNDVVYVQPNNAQINSAAYNRNSSVYISIASVLISIIVLISR